jgi:hypothetical protein
VITTFVALFIMCAAILSIAPSVLADDYRVLIVREGGIDKAKKLPIGKLVINAGYIDGVEEGMTGTVWRKNKFKGQIDIADIEVIEAKPYESVCKFTVRHPDFYILKKDRAAVDQIERAEADILARGIEALDNDLCYQALLYFENIFCVTQDNAFVQQRIQDCRNRVEKQLADGITKEQQKKGHFRVKDCLELAERHHKYDNDLAADMYLKLVLATDSTNAKAIELRGTVPVQDFSALLSPARCD